jgi:hypothetical protein
MKVRLFAGLAAVSLLATALSATVHAEDWHLRRNKENVTCSVQPANRKPLEGDLVGVYPTRQQACADARKRHTDEVANIKGCLVYAPGTMDECRRDGVILPK